MPEPPMSSLAQWLIDFATIFGVVGTIATLTGLGLTFWQVRETKRAAEAARDAAEKTARADRNEFARYAIAACHRLIGEAKLHIDHGEYRLAALRCADIADHLAQVVRSAPALLSSCEERIESLRNWEASLKDHAASKKALKPGSIKKWHEIVVLLYATIDPAYGPFESVMKDDKR